MHIPFECEHIDGYMSLNLRMIRTFTTCRKEKKNNKMINNFLRYYISKKKETRIVITTRVFSLSSTHIYDISISCLKHILSISLYIIYFYTQRLMVTRPILDCYLQFFWFKYQKTRIKG